MIYSVLLVLFLTGCHEKSRNEDQLIKNKPSVQQWNSYWQQLNNHSSKKLKNTLVLVTHTTNCRGCLKELSYWNDKYTSNKSKIDIKMIVVEQYRNVFEAFLTTNNIQIPAYRDSIGRIVKQDYLYDLPSKIYFNEKGLPQKSRPIGKNGNPKLFYESFIQ